MVWYDVIWYDVVWYDIWNLGRENEGVGELCVWVWGLRRKEGNGGWVIGLLLFFFFFFFFTSCLDWIGLNWIVTGREWLFFGREWVDGWVDDRQGRGMRFSCVKGGI